MAIATGTVSIDETSSADQSLVSLSISERTNIHAFWFDGTNITQNINYIKAFVDLGATGTTPREIGSLQTRVDIGESENALARRYIQVDTDIEFKFACPGTGAGSVDVYYRMLYDDAIETSDIVDIKAVTDVAPSKTQMKEAFEKRSEQQRIGGNDYSNIFG